jgi:hypothetical protein
MNEMLRLEKQKSQAGQTTVEYILIVALSVTIILGLASQFYKPFGNWMQDYMGQYLECLLDVGELPTIGGSSDSGECTSKFSAFSVTGGRPPINSGSSNNSGNSDRDRNKPANSGGNTAGDSGGSGTSASVANRSRSGGGKEPFAVGKRGGSDGVGSGQGNGDGQIVEKLPASQYMKLNNNRGSSVISSNELGRRGELNQSFIVNKRKDDDGPEKAETVKLAEEEEYGRSQKSKKFIVKPPERKPTSDEEQMPWSFSEYFKYGLIILIVVALLLFLFGQILQISKSMEK